MRIPANPTNRNEYALHKIYFMDEATGFLKKQYEINRIADGLHVEQEDFIRPWEKSPDPLPKTFG